MSKGFAFQTMKRMNPPQTAVIGSHLVTDNDGKPVFAKKTEFDRKTHGDTPFVRAGQPLWRKPKPFQKIMHFINEAARRRCGGMLQNATPNDVHIVAVYRGAPMRLLGYYRSQQARKARGGMI